MQPRKKRLVRKSLLHERVNFLFKGEFDSNADGSAAFGRVAGSGPFVGRLHEAWPAASDDVTTHFGENLRETLDLFVGEHAWLGPRRSLYDELGAGYTLLVRRPGSGTGTIEKAARTRGVPLRVLDVPDQDPVHRGPALALVRPDQYVAWAGDGEPGDGLVLIDRVRGSRVS